MTPAVHEADLLLRSLDHECVTPGRVHVPMPALTPMHFLDREHWFGTRLRAESDGILVTVYTVGCTGEPTGDELLLTNSDAEVLRDALNEYLDRQDEFYRKAQERRWGPRGTATVALVAREAARG